MKTSAALLNSRNQEESLNHILRGIQAIGFDRARLYLLADDGKSLVGKAQVGMDERFIGLKWSVADDWHTQTILAERSPRVFKREDGQPRHSEEGLDKEEVDEALGRQVEYLYFDPKEPRKIGKMLHLSADGKVANYETFVKSKYGQKIPIRYSCTWLYDSNGKRIRSVDYFEDLRPAIERERRIELLLKANNIVAQAENMDDGLKSLAEMIVTLLDFSTPARRVGEGHRKKPGEIIEQLSYQSVSKMLLTETG